MDSIFNEIFGPFGMALVIFILAFTIVAMPVGIYLALKRGAKIAEEQDRKLEASHAAHSSHA